MELDDGTLLVRTRTLVDEVLVYLGVEVSPGTTPEGLGKLFKLWVSRSSGSLTEKIGPSNLVEDFKKRLETTLKLLGQPVPASSAKRRNYQIELLRFWVLARTLHLSQAAFPSPPDLPETEYVVVQRQLRALELIIRALVRNRFSDEGELRAKIDDFFKEPKLKEWEPKADPGDILSGSTFTELANLFLHNAAFPDGEGQLFGDSPLLRLLGKRQATLRLFLTYANLTRNTLAHHKVVYPESAALLELCFDDIMEAVRYARLQEHTTVDPKSFDQASPTDLSEFLKRLTQREMVDARLAELPESIDTLQVGVGNGLRRLGYALAGIAAVAVMTATGLWFSHDTNLVVARTDRTVANTAAEVGQIGADTRQTAASAQRIDQTTSQTALQIQQAMRGDLLVAAPSEPDHHWHNFLIHERQNESVEAEASLLGYVHTGGDKYDALLLAVGYLRARHDRAEVRPLLLGQVPGLPSAAMRTALARLLSPSAAETELAEVHAAWPNPAMPLYERARLHSMDVMAMMTNDELLEEHRFLGEFLASVRERPLGLTLQQPGTAASIVDDAERRFGNLTEQTLGLMREAVTAKVSGSFTFPLKLMITVAEPTKSLNYRFDGGDTMSGPPSENDRLFGNLRSSANNKQPVSLGSVQMPNGQLPTVIPVQQAEIILPVTPIEIVEVRYVDLNGIPHGPFTPQVDFAGPRIKVLDNHSECVPSTAYSWPQGSRRNVLSCSSRLSLPFSLQAVRYSFSAPTPTQEVTPKLSKRDTIEIPVPSGATRFTYQVVFSDGSRSSVRIVAP